MWNTLTRCFAWIWKYLVGASVLAGLVGFAALVYPDWFSFTNVSSQIVSETNVLDVRQPLANLQVVFNGENIQEKNLNLKVFRVRFENNGRTDITQNDFDQDGDWGLKVEDGSILEVRLVDTNSKHILEKLNPHVEGDLIKLNRIIFDKKDNFTIEFLVLHDKNAPPSLVRVGKISGVKGSDLELSPVDTSESFFVSLLAGIFYGSWLVAIVRLLFLFLFSIVVFLAVVFIGVAIHEKREKERQQPRPPQQPST